MAHQRKGYQAGLEEGYNKGLIEARVPLMDTRKKLEILFVCLLSIIDKTFTVAEKTELTASIEAVGEKYRQEVEDAGLNEELPEDDTIN